MSQLDIHNAKRALGARLVAWGIEDAPAAKATGFIDDLVELGWMMSPQRESRPGAPKASEMCPMHRASFADHCSGCRADELAGDEHPAPKRERASMDADVRAVALAAARAGLSEGVRG